MVNAAWGEIFIGSYFILLEFIRNPNCYWFLGHKFGQDSYWLLSSTADVVSVSQCAFPMTSILIWDHDHRPCMGSIACPTSPLMLKFPITLSNLRVPISALLSSYNELFRRQNVGMRTNTAIMLWAVYTFQICPKLIFSS